MLKRFGVVLLLALFSSGAFAEFRTWRDQKGNSFEGELVSEMGNQICLRSKEGRIHKVQKDSRLEFRELQPYSRASKL